MLAASSAYFSVIIWGFRLHGTRILYFWTTNINDYGRMVTPDVAE
jgi:hypothetical protein